MTVFRLQFSSVGFPAFAFLLFLLCLQKFSAQAQTINHTCPPASCGKLHNISYPFRLRGDPKHCGFPDYELSCENNVTVLYLYAGKYHVQSINYNNSTLRVVDAAVDPNNCSSTPRFSLSAANFSWLDPYNYYPLTWDSNITSRKLMLFMKCSQPVNNSSLYVGAAPCLVGRYYYCVMIGGNIMDVEDSCTVELMVMSSLPAKDVRNTSYMDIYRDLLYGFELSWYEVECESCRGEEYCHLEGKTMQSCKEGIFIRIWRQLQLDFLLYVTIIGGAIVGRNMLCSPFAMAFLIYTWRRRHLSMYNTVEEFLQSQNNLMPIRYSYSEIRKMTNGFKEKLGEGGYGSVYKGRLRSGPFAAIKMLGKSITNGQDFINEVATIGRIHHVNVVKLIGFCVEGSKRALVYDFMANGSLDKYVFSRKGYITLRWEKMYEIALGVARGIEYLHHGCNMQILHFDIKPHNILLDENFIPKVSDFGLAKLYPTGDHIVSLTAVRGTIGYMAPELFYKNIGNVSYKADVYSYGMLLMEMAGKKKNLNAEAETENSSQYFPGWVHNEVSRGKIELGEDAAEGEEQLVKKMITVALWCIQMNPSNRPPMNKVVEMLEGDVESLELPPKPVLFPETVPENDCWDYPDENWSSTVSADYAESSCLIANSY